MPRRTVTLLIAALIALLVLSGASGRSARAQSDPVDADTLLITPTTQGTFDLPHSGVTLEIGYAAVEEPARLTITGTDAESGSAVTIEAHSTGGERLRRFEMPLLLTTPDGTTHVIGWPQTIPAPRDPADRPPDSERWLVVFDAHGIYAQPAWVAAPERIVYLGPLEHYTPDLVEHNLDTATLSFEAAPPIERSILRTDRRDGQPAITALPTAARAARYADRFVPEDLRNPGGLMLLGWVPAERLHELVRALRATIPPDPDLPAPGVPQAPLDLILPFDCADMWTVSWGYHHSTPQNRFAVDFASLGPLGTGGQPVYAAHAGTLWLKRYGTPDYMIDVGLSARVLAADGITSTVYGHLSPPDTFGLWDVDAGSVPDFAWVERGPVAQGQLIGIAGRSGYATGPHIHFALWSWDQSLYQPVPLGSLVQFERGRTIPPDMRRDCALYHR